MKLSMTLHNADLAPEELQALTLGLARTINRETPVQAALPEEAASSGSKGDPITLGTIVLTFLSSGTAVAMFKVLQSYLERDSSLEVELSRSDGRTFRVNATNLKADQVDQTLRLLADFAEE